VRLRRLSQLTLVLAAVALLAAACYHGNDEAAAPPPAGDENGEAQPGEQQQTGQLLQRVRDRGQLICGVNDAVPGFGFVTEGGEYEGFDVEYCRVVAAAILGDSNAVDFRPLTAEQRFTALQAGEIDVLIRNTTWTATRDGAEGATFLHTTFFDGQGMMVRADSAYQELEDMGGTTICVLSGTTTELNLETQFQARNTPYTPLSFEENDAIQQAFVAGRCDGWTSDLSQLAAIRSNWPEGQGGPEALRILEVTMSKEPLGPVVRDGDDAWAQAVNWAVMATVQAEELGITQANLDEMLQSDDPEILRFLGQPPEEGAEVFDPGLGLDTDFAANVIRQVGNYAEIYERNVGPDTPLGLQRGVNALWTDGGIQYVPPYR
jgi:general L-amino acid transport system substrate-binding protein